MNPSVHTAINSAKGNALVFLLQLQKKEGRKAMEMMKQGSVSAINDTEGTVEEMVEQITGGKGEFIQKYASYIDIGYVDCESDMWSTLMYYPSPEMPKKNMSEYVYWYTYMDLYMAVLDRLTDCLQTVNIQKCKCGFSVIIFDGYIMQYHREFLNP